MRYRVRHLTRLDYDTAVANARFNLRLKPATWPDQTIRSYSLGFDPLPALREEGAGPYCVNRTHIEFQAPIQYLEIESQFAAEVSETAIDGNRVSVAQVRAEALAMKDISAVAPTPYLFASRIAGSTGEIGNWAVRFLPPDSCVIDSALALTEAIHSDFRYKPGVTNSTTSPDQAFRQREGVCQDFAHIMITALRANGIPAAYVSGYLRTKPPANQPRLIGADAMHAWVNVWCGLDAGWIGFDPTNNCIVREDHIKIGMGRDYADVAPIDGTFIGSSPQSMTVSVDVHPGSEGD